MSIQQTNDKKEKKKDRDSDSTIAEGMKIADPAIQGILDKASWGDNLGKLKQNLFKYKLIHNDAGIKVWKEIRAAFDVKEVYTEQTKDVITSMIKDTMNLVPEKNRQNVTWELKRINDGFSVVCHMNPHPDMTDAIDPLSVQLTDRFKMELAKHFRKIEVISGWTGFAVDKIKGINGLKVGTDQFTAVATKTQVFLLSKTPCEELYDERPEFMGIDFKKKAIAYPEDGNGPTLYVYRMLSEDMQKLFQISSKQEKAPKRVAVVDSIALDQSQGGIFPVNEEVFKQKLLQCVYVKGVVMDTAGNYTKLEGADAFDLKQFVTDLWYIFGFKDNNDNPYYSFMTVDGSTYRLYVNCNQHDLEKFSENHILAYKEDMCRLYREV